MSSGYINTLEYLKDRLSILCLETQENYFIEKLDLLLKYINEKIKTYKDSKILPDIYVTLVREFKRVLEEVPLQGNKELLFSICSDIEEEIEKINNKQFS